MNDRITNYHTHTWRCMHATGTEEEYIQTALQAGYEILGFADHTPWRYHSDYVSPIRMTPAQLPDYTATLRRLRQKYAGQIRLYIGLEAEYFPAYLPWLQQQVEQQGIEYLILGNHYPLTDEHKGYFGRNPTPERLRQYAECTIAGMETGLFRYLAHPDLCFKSLPEWSAEAERCIRRICEAAKALDMPLEYNLSGLEYRAQNPQYIGFTSDPFLRIACETGNTMIVGIDAHAPQPLNGRGCYDVAAARKRLRAMGLTVLNTLPGLE